MRKNTYKIILFIIIITIALISISNLKTAKTENVINVAVIDTGIESDDWTKEFHIKKYFITNDNDNKHGNLVTSIILKNLVSYNKVLIHNIDIGEYDKIDIQNLIKGIKMAIDLKVDIINISLGTYQNNIKLKEVINDAIDQDIIVICASGDDSTNQYLYPASYDGVISISCIDINNNPFITNNINNRISLCEIGENVKSFDLKNGEKYLGSSLATALFTSKVITLKQYHPDLNNELLFNLIKNASIDLGVDGKDNIFGYGYVDIKRAKKYLDKRLLGGAK